MPDRKTGIVGVVITALSGIVWLIRSVADLDFVIQTIDDPSWLGAIVNWSLENPDRIFGLFMVFGLLVSWYAYRESRKLAEAKPTKEAPIIEPSSPEPNDDSRESCGNEIDEISVKDQERDPSHHVIPTIWRGYSTYRECRYQDTTNTYA